MTNTLKCCGWCKNTGTATHIGVCHKPDVFSLAKGPLSSRVSFIGIDHIGSEE